METIVELWIVYCAYFIKEWPFSLMWTVAIPLGLVFLWRMIMESDFDFTGLW